MQNNRFKKLFAEADSAFNGAYKSELDFLLGLSKAEIDSLTPGTTDSQVYLALIKTIEEASKNNISQADLIGNIKDLGEGAIKIAKKIPQFAALL